MARADQTEIRVRIVIERPVPGVLHSLQEDDAPLDHEARADLGLIRARHRLTAP